MKAYLISLGCDKTLVDSEHIIGSLAASGVFLTDDINEADLCLVNTCCFIHDALEESIETIIEVAKEKPDNAKLCVFGCMAKRYYDDILSDLPEADIVIESADPMLVSEAICDLLGLTDPKWDRKLTGVGYSSYLKIAEGCDKHCTYCVIPDIRGRYISVPMEELLKEAKELAQKGIKELNIVAQETTMYGVDLYGKKSLHKLLRSISEIEGIEWIRLLYAYPEEIYDELIFEMRDNPKICHYIDMPIQHGDDHILRKMGRRTDSNSIRNTVNRLRREIPDICIRTTLISGFPGESEENHSALMEFVKEMKFNRLGVFPYSKEDNTPAGEMIEQIPEEIKIKRADDIMSLQEKICIELSKGFLGKTFKCLVEGYLYEEDIYQARTYMDAPDIDGVVFFKSDRELISGDFVEIKITESNGYDLIGELI